MTAQWLQRLLPATCFPHQKAVTVISDLANLPLSNAGDADTQLGLLRRLVCAFHL